MRRAAKIFLVIFVILLALAWIPLSHHLRAAAVLLRISNPDATGFIPNYHSNPVVTENRSFDVDGSSNRARLYRPVGVRNPPAIVVLHGVHHLGIEEPRLQNFSRALASHGYLIFTPELPGIDNYRVTAASHAVIGRAAEELKKISGADRVGVLGLSFAGGIALNTAAEPRFKDDFAFVAAVGAQDDVARVLRFFATNEIPLVNGGVARMQAHEYGPLVVIYSHPEDFFSASDAPIADEAIRYQLWEDLPRAHAAAGTMSADGQRRMQLLFEHHTEALAPVMLASIDKYRSEYESSSPRGHISSLAVPVFLLHGSGDNVIPPAETLWLQHDLPPGVVRECLITPLISHVSLDQHSKVVDNLELVHWMSAMLDEADAHARPARQ